MSAEMPSPFATPAVGWPLQWGRAQMSAEMGRSIRADRGSRASSMGPRSDERGNPAPANPPANSRRSSMGPRSEERGNNKETEKGREMEASSMGPRSDERGNAVRGSG